MVRVSTLLRRWLAAQLPFLPVDARELVEGLLAEADRLPPGREQARWLLGGARFVLGPRGALYVLALAAAAAGLLAANATANADVGGPACLLLLVLEAAALGAAAPRLAWLTGLVLGGTLAAGGFLTLAAGGSLPPTMHPSGVAGAASLLVLAVPALVAAWVAARVRRALV